MTGGPQRDKSNGYEGAAARFLAARDRTIGADIVRSWSKALPSGAAVLDLGCGDGLPVSQVLVDQGFEIYAVDASPTMLAAYRRRFPGAHTQCATAEDSDLFNRQFDGVVAVGLMFLLDPGDQKRLIVKMAGALKPTGKLLFTAPQQRATWADAITGLESVSLGAGEYQRLLRDASLAVTSEADDEGGNHYYIVARVPQLPFTG